MFCVSPSPTVLILEGKKKDKHKKIYNLQKKKKKSREIYLKKYVVFVFQIDQLVHNIFSGTLRTMIE